MTNLKIDSDLIRELAALLENTGLTEIEITDNGQGLRIAKKNAAEHKVAPTVMPTASPAIPFPTSEVTAHGVDGNAVTSPVVGTVYLSPQPGDPPFIKPGDSVRAGDTLLIIEAMKVMNQISAPRAGTVKKILADDAQPVEFGEPLVILA